MVEGLRVSERRNPNRLSIWIPDKDEWVFQAIEEVRQSAENLGVPVSKSDVIREALLNHFRAMRPSDDVPEIDD